MKPILSAMLWCLAIIAINGCKKHDFPFPGNKTFDLEFYGLTEGNTLVKLHGKKPGQSYSPVSVTGLQQGEKLLAIDFRPATGQLYGLGNSNRLYIINHVTGAATALGTEAFTPALNGTVAGFDFNPTVDRIRVVTANGQNLRLHPELGTVAFVDGNLNPGTPAVNAVAYLNNFAGATATTLFNIDVASGKLYRQDPPNNGTLVEVGSLNENISGEGGFDISPDNKYALAALGKSDKNGAKQMLYHVDLNSGKLSGICELDKKIIGLAIPTNPVAYAADGSNNLHIFNPAMPGTTISKPISGMQSGETVAGLDMRPVTGQLYALGSTNRIYTINTATGGATAISATPFAAVAAGVSYGFDFNPVVDRIRVVNSNGANMRVHPVTGELAATDANLNPGSPAVSAAAYTNSFPGTTSTVLFDIDHAAGKLYKQDPPNNGTLVEVGSLGVSINASNGFDIGGSSNNAWALLTSGGNTKLYSINLSTGKAQATGSFPVQATSFAVGAGF
ncbi:DUF4394 domain-containing protein [Foetidibacter luteolus]|uniref:DUF4394 domain-containing protein n=1 Tax=Foetidibacter luteolus TaxID=2608880 RepID=UPI00129A7A23|nr:DUF4394 domain-containing protein [Foetidibacter luteolus]